MSRPERVGRFVVEELLGRGSMGTVYLAHDPVIDRRVAVKVMHSDLGGERGEVVRRRFVQEARAAGRLIHPNIVTVFDVGEDPETSLAFIAMDYVQGETLWSLLASERRFTVTESVRLATTLARALDFAHSKGVVHRDIKASNVLLTRDGEAKITDFGIARLDTSDLTAEGTILGSPSYMSPEQMRGLPVDGRSDLYSLGVILFELLTGTKPFKAKSLPELSTIVVQQPPPDPAMLRPGLPALLAEVVLRCLAKDPDERFQTGSELADALASVELPLEPNVDDVFGRLEKPALAPLEGSVFFSHSVEEPTPIGAATLPTLEASTTTARGRRRMLATVVLLLAAIGVVVLLAVLGSRPESSDRSAVTTTPVPAEPVSRPTPVPSATLVLLHRNRLGAARIWVEVDKQEVWSRQMAAPKNPVARIAGDKLQWSLSVPAGRRRITVGIRGQSMKVNETMSVEVDLRAGTTRSLRVSLNPYTDKMTLEWER